MSMVLSASSGVFICALTKSLPSFKVLWEMGGRNLTIVHGIVVRSAQSRGVNISR